jgi:hypothetical protein
VKVQDVESRRALDLGNAARCQQSDIQFFTPPAKIEIASRAAARSQRQTECAANQPIAEREIAAEINVRGDDRRQQRERVPQQAGYGSMAENA